MTLEETEANFMSMAELARLHNVRVILSSVLPVHHYTARSDATFPLRPPEKITELNRGRAFFTTPETLGDYVLVDFLEQKRVRRRPA